MGLRNALVTAAACAAIGAGVLVAAPGVALAHDAVLTKTETRPCGADSAWSGTFTAKSDGDYNKNWQNRYKIGSGGTYSAYSAYTDDQVPFGPIAVGPFAANVSSVTVYVESHWKDKSSDSGHYTQEANITLYRPSATQCPTSTTTGTWTPTDGTCANPQGNLAVTADAGATYSGSAAGAYAPGATVTGGFAAQQGYVFQGNAGPFSHTFGVTGAPCQLQSNPQVQIVAVCGSWQLKFSNIVDGVDPWESVPDATLTFTVNGVTRTLTAKLGETVSDGSTVTEDTGDVTIVVNGTTYVAGSDCAPNQITPPDLTASYDCVSQKSAYVLTPAQAATWTAGAVTLNGTTYTVTITPNEGYTFGAGANQDGTITLTATFQVTTSCEHTVAEPQVTPPTCAAAGSVVLTPSDFYTWTTNQDGTYTAVAKQGVRLVGTTTFGPYAIGQLTGEQCVVPTIDLAAFTPVCQADTPFIQYEIRVSGTPNDDATLTFYDLDGNEVARYVDVPLSGRVIYPGASSNPQDWPGWKLNSNGLWEMDPTDARLRDGLTVKVEVNPTATAAVAYPPATAACSDPDQTQSEAPTTTVQIVQLPSTGSGTGGVAVIGTLLVLAGGALLFVVRRPRQIS